MRNCIYSQYDEYFYLTYSKYMALFYFYISWLLCIKQQSSETATSWQTEIRTHWENTRWNKMYCLLKMVFSELDSKILLMKLTTGEGRIKRRGKELRKNFTGEVCRQQIRHEKGTPGRLPYLTTCAEWKHSCSSTLKAMGRKRRKANPTRTEKVNEEKQRQAWTARFRCPTRVEDSMLPVTCDCDTLIFSPLCSTLHPHVSWLPPLSHYNNPWVFMTSLSCCATSPIPDCPRSPVSWKCPPQAGRLPRRQDPRGYLQLQLPCQPISSILCPVFRPPCTRRCAALLSHGFPHWSTFL